MLGDIHRWREIPWCLLFKQHEQCAMHIRPLPTRRRPVTVIGILEREHQGDKCAPHYLDTLVEGTCGMSPSPLGDLPAS